MVATKADRHARGFTCWDQFVAMRFCHLGRVYSLREICGCLVSCEGRLAHLGVTAPPRSTLAYANAADICIDMSAGPGGPLQCLVEPQRCGLAR